MLSILLHIATVTPMVLMPTEVSFSGGLGIGDVPTAVDRMLVVGAHDGYQKMMPVIR